jgi:starch-binding outer membrane protein, SusD/RagB family
MLILFRNLKNISFPLLIVFANMTACKKFVTVDTPSTKTSTESAYKDDYSATAVLTGLYARMSTGYLTSVNLPATSLFEELSADNLSMVDVTINDQYRAFYQNVLEPQYLYSGNTQYWTNVYNMMYNINASIEGLANNSFLTPEVSKRLLGEAYFLRGFCYFYLVNLYGDVPLILNTRYEESRRLSRTSVDSVYKQIESDLNNAEKLLDYNYVSADVIKGTFERVRPNLAAVNALQARVYLYQKKYLAAEEAATKVLEQSSVYSLTDINSAFLKNSAETIWALQPVDNNFNTREAGLYILPAGGPNYEHPVYTSMSLINSFESGDLRRLKWIDSVIASGGTIYAYPAKYKVGFVDGSKTFTEYTIVLRLSEQLLIRAEARSEMGNIEGAVEDLNTIRTRSRAAATTGNPNPLPAIPATSTSTELQQKIMQERRVELFAEWGHRWFDLKRTNTIDSVMIKAEEYKGGVWSGYKALYPVPVSDILLNPAIVQNPGYTN